MKNILKKILAVFCAVYFLTAGTGYNIIKYCCDDCKHAGIESVINESCESIHSHEGYNHCHCTEHNQKSNYTLSCHENDFHADNCQIIRINTDTPSVQEKSEFNSNLEFDLKYSFSTPCSILEHHHLIERSSFTPPDILPLYSGREILSLHTTLLI